MNYGDPSIKVLEKTKLFHKDSMICGLTALAVRANSPTIFKAQALELQ